ncbi:MAG: hypothetical protein K8R53_09240 [Bacteroidales bacterium]|nr:hypothetical protein [Bacteroidales bacterium]
MIICVVELPGVRIPVQPLKSGEMVETDEDFMQIVIDNNLTKLNVISGIKGDFDNVIFVEMPEGKMVMSEELISKPYLPYSETKWVLILKSGIDENNQGSNEWAQEVLSTGKTYFDRSTLFTLSHQSGNSICLNWNAEFDLPEYVQVTSEDLVEELKDINQIVINSKGNNAMLQVGLTNSLATLKNPYSTNIANSILDNLGN